MANPTVKSGMRDTVDFPTDQRPGNFGKKIATPMSSRFTRDGTAKTLMSMKKKTKKVRGK